MSESTLLKLAITAAIMVVFAFFAGSYDRAASIDDSGKRNLVVQLNTADVGAIEVSSAESEEDPVRLERVGRDEFAVTSKLSYPASNTQINSLIRKCIDIRTDALLSDDASDHADLGLADGSEKLQKVLFFDRDGKQILGILAANADGDEGAAFNVRLASEDRAYRTSAWLSFQSKSLDYVAKEILEVSRDDVAKVELQNAGGEYSIVSPEKGEVELQGVPDGKKPQGKTYESVFGAASRLTFTGFQPATEAKDLVFDASFVLETRAKAQYTIEIARKEEPAENEGEDAAEAAEPKTTYFARCSARYVGPPEEQITVKSDESQEGLEDVEEMLKAPKLCADFNHRHQSWVYEIASYTGDNLVKPFEDLLEDDDGKPTEVAASHILISYEGAERSDVTGRTKEEARSRAQEVLAKVEAGEDFAALAEEFSDGPSKTKGGDLGTFAFESMAPAFSEAAFALEIGATSGIVETGFGFHIIRRTE